MSIPSEPEVRVTVDPDRCFSSGTCLASAPQLFELDDDGVAIPRRPVVPPTDALTKAIARCPGQAIRADEES